MGLEDPIEVGRVGRRPNRTPQGLPSAQSEGELTGQHDELVVEGEVTPGQTDLVG